MSEDRCSIIAKLLLIENEVKKIENASNAISITLDAAEGLDYLEAKYGEISPIEKIMYAIITRVKDNLYNEFNGKFELGLQCQKEIGIYRVDFLVSATFSNTQVIIECDGHDFHEKTKEQARRDKERDRWLTSQGYKILRYTGSELYNDFDRIEKELSELLDYSPNSLFWEIK